MTPTFDFAALAAQLEPQCRQMIARYEQKRSALLPMAHLFQEHEGYVSQAAMEFIAQQIDCTVAEVESTVSFYTLFFRKPVGKYMLQVCRGLMCELNGAEAIMAYLREKLGIGHLETTEDGLFSYEEVECLAACDKPTCMQVNLEFVYSLTPAMIDDMLTAMRNGTYDVTPLAQTKAPERSWKVRQDLTVGTGGKSPGTASSSNPNNAGGVGDASGVIMLDSFVGKGISFTGRSSERLVRDARSVAELIEEESANGGAH